MLFEPGAPVSLKRLNPPWIPNSVSQFCWAAAGAARRRLSKASRWSFLTRPSREVSGPVGRRPPGVRWRDDALTMIVRLCAISPEPCEGLQDSRLGERLGIL